MLVMVESNEGADREKKKREEAEEQGQTRVDPSNLRVVARLKKYFPNLQQTALTCGDINVILDGGGILAIERKRAGDFLGSIASGRIFRQVENMANNATWSCVIIEGLISFDEDDMAVIPMFNKKDEVEGYEKTMWRGVSVRGAMYAIQWSCCPIFTIEPSSLPSLVADLAKFCSKPAEHQQMLGRKRIVTFPPVTLSEEIIASFPRVGLKRARALLEFTQKNNDVNTATLAEALSWGSILDLVDRKSRPEGWGDKTIEDFRNTLGLETGELTIVENKNRKSPRKGNVNGRK